MITEANTYYGDSFHGHAFSSDPHDIYKLLEGDLLHELQIGFRIQSQSDVDHAIKILQIAKNCFIPLNKQPEYIMLKKG